MSPDVPVEIVVRVPEFVPAGRALPVSAWFEPNGYNLAEAGEGAVKHPVDARTIGIFVDVEKPHAPAAAARALAVQLGWPSYIYTDRRPFRAALLPGDIPILFAYADSTKSAIENLAEIDADAQAQSGPWAIAISLHRGLIDGGYDRPEQLVLDVAAGAWRIAVARGAVAVHVFAYERGGLDGCTKFLSFMTALGRMRAASHDWTAFPRRAKAPTPAPTPTPIPAPAPPVPISFYARARSL